MGKGMSTENRFCQVLLRILDDIPFGGATLRSGDTPLLEVDPTDISILGDNRLGSLVIPPNTSPTSREIDLRRLANFMRELSPTIIRLNHLGIGFKTRDIISEVKKIKHLVTKNQGLHLYEEESGMANERWFFLGNRENWECPMFEIVMSKSNQTHDYWKPQFQIDFDTSLSIEELKQLTNKFLRPEFLVWELDVPEVGVVCAMGVVGDINGTKISLGLGTALRNTRFFREKILKEII